MPNGGVDAAARIQIDNRQLEIGNVFTLPPLRSNELLDCAVVGNLLSGFPNIFPRFVDVPYVTHRHSITIEMDFS